MFDEAANHVGQHGVSVLARAAQLGGSLKMSHKIVVPIRLVAQARPARLSG
jgi:hypothetical protein